MSPLAGLRLNCLLVPAVIVAVAVAVTWGAWWQGVQAAATEKSNEVAAALGIAASLRPEGDPQACLTADPRWHGVAVLRWQDGRAHLLGSAGTLALEPQDPHPDLVLAVHGPIAWADGPVIAAAAPLPMLATQERRLLYAETAVTAADPTIPLLATGLLVILGAALGWYLTARIYAPVEWLTQEAAAAVAGRPRRVGERSSLETAMLRSSVITLADKVRSGVTPGEDPGAPQ